MCYKLAPAGRQAVCWEQQQPMRRRHDRCCLFLHGCNPLLYLREAADQAGCHSQKDDSGRRMTSALLSAGSPGEPSHAPLCRSARPRPRDVCTQQPLHRASLPRRVSERPSASPHFSFLETCCISSPSSPAPLALPVYSLSEPDTVCAEGFHKVFQTELVLRDEKNSIPTRTDINTANYPNECTSFGQKEENLAGCEAPMDATRERTLKSCCCYCCHVRNPCWPLPASLTLRLFTA